MRFLTGIICASLMAFGCGRSGESGDNGKASSCCAEFEDIRGSVSSESLAGVSLENWVLLLIERDTGTARSAVLGQGGLFLLRNVKINAAHTLALLSSDHILKSVVTFRSEQTGAVRQYFKIGRRYLGNILHDGPTLSLQNPETVTVEANIVKDADGDGIPDGMVQVGAKTKLEGEVPDLPLDISFVDVDFDGLVNSLDHDDDNDGIYDMADADSNGDDVEDREQEQSDLHLPEGVESVSSQYEYSPSSEGTKAYITFTARLRDDVDPFAVQVQGPTRLLEGATFEGFDNTGAIVDAAWNRRLADDGDSQDELPNDRIFAKKIKLASPSLRPLANEVFLVQLLFGAEDNPWAFTYPISFPSIGVGAITAAFNAANHIVTFNGKPFGAIEDYEWTVLLSNSDGVLLWSSQSIPGTTKTFEIPAPQLTSGEAYQVSVSARLPDRVRANPSYVVHSSKITVSIP